MEQKINAIILSICLTVCSICSADNCDVAPIKKGAAAPCDGFYFNKDAENAAEQARNDADFFKKLSGAQADKSKILEDENDVLQKRLNLYIQESKDLSQAKAKSETTETIIRMAYFFGGVLITGLIVRNVRPY